MSARFLDSEEKKLLKLAADVSLKRSKLGPSRGLSTDEFSDLLELLQFLGSPYVDVRVSWNDEGDRVIPRPRGKPSLTIAQELRKEAKR